MDLTASIAPKSDQINADDLISGPRTFTVESVTEGSTEQPFNIHLVENPGRPYRPSKSMRRVLVMAWGKESDDWPAGGRITLFRDPEVKFGRDEVGGIKIRALSHIDRPMTFALTEKRGSRKPHTVDPLPDVAPATPEPTAEQVAASTDVETLKGMWRASGPERRKQITERVAELKAAPAEDDGDPTFPAGGAA